MESLPLEPGQFLQFRRGSVFFLSSSSFLPPHVAVTRRRVAIPNTHSLTYTHNGDRFERSTTTTITTTHRRQPRRICDGGLCPGPETYRARRASSFCIGGQLGHFGKQARRASGSGLGHGDSAGQRASGTKWRSNQRRLVEGSERSEWSAWSERSEWSERSAWSKRSEWSERRRQGKPLIASESDSVLRTLLQEKNMIRLIKAAS